MLRLYNTLTRSVDPFSPLNPPQVGVYACGPTVYDVAHIGNLRTYVFEDVLVRALGYCGYKVQHVMNVTDVGHLVSDADEGEDKMEQSARQQGKGAWELAQLYWDAFRADMAALNVREPNVWCKATDHIPEQIDQVRALEAKGLTYTISDGVYFDTSKFPNYGQMARLDVAGQQAGARVEMVAGKRNPTDFALWKFSPKDQKRQMEWDSPWGVGFPGWHIECSAMAMKYLGEQIDIHCGGVDHVKVHHTNEIAQAEGITGKPPWVRWWLHGEFLVLESDKMAKSGGNFITLAVVKEMGFDPLSYRYFCLNAHYRKQLTFTWEALEGATNGYQRLKNAVIELKAQGDPGQPSPRHVQAFRGAVEDDLNMPKAIAALWGVLRSSDVSAPEKLATALEMDRVLGLGVAEMTPQAVRAGDDVQALLAQREQARRDKDYAEADRIRDALLEQGYEIVDTPEGPKLKQRA